MAFELKTNEYKREFDFGDAPEPMYQTMFETNGAHHFVDPDVFLGEQVDEDENGQPHHQALGDDNDGTDATGFGCGGGGAARYGGDGGNGLYGGGGGGAASGNAPNNYGGNGGTGCVIIQTY